jgi:hypothetical protein
MKTLSFRVSLRHIMLALGILVVLNAGAFSSFVIAQSGETA